MLDTLPPLDIWYMSAQSLCNFDCAYCCSASFRTTSSQWATEESASEFARVLQWIAALPYSIALRVATLGEPFISDDFLRGVATLTSKDNIRFVELQTNGSLLKRNLPKLIDTYGAVASKLSLWITFHHTETSVEQLVEAAVFARSLGVFVVVNGLLFPDSLEAVEKLVEQCRANDVPVNVDMGQTETEEERQADLARRPATTPQRGKLPLATTAPRGTEPRSEGYIYVPIPEENLARSTALVSGTQHPKMAFTSLVAAEAPLGLGCSAGSDYIFISPSGDIFPCLAYSERRPQSKIGSALDPTFVLPLRSKRYTACALTDGCRCKEDFTHMEIASPHPPRERSIGYWPRAAGEVEVAPDPKLVERLERARKSKLLNVLGT